MKKTNLTKQELERQDFNEKITITREELKKLNSSTASYNKLIVGIALATLLVSIASVVIRPVAL